MDEIIESIENGQRIQALKQLVESPYGLSDLLEELNGLSMYDEIIRMVRVSENIDFIEYNYKKVRNRK